MAGSNADWGQTVSSLEPPAQDALINWAEFSRNSLTQPGAGALTMLQNQGLFGLENP